MSLAPTSASSVVLPALGPVAFVTFGYALVFGAALWHGLRGDPMDAAICLAPAIAVLFLGRTSQADRRQYVVRLFAAAMFLPALLMMWASSQPNAGLWLIGFVVVHIAALLILVWWLASFTTRIEPRPSAERVSEERLGRRLASLDRGDGACYFHRGDTAAEIIMDLREDADRTHRVRFDVASGEHVVRVQELVGASGARPRTASERSMRTLGDAPLDPARPDAQKIWARTWQTTMIIPERLAATRTEFSGDTVRFTLPDDYPQDTEAWVTLMAAVVTRSGYAWQPRLFRSKNPR